jgi:hypothetical protein
MRSGRLFAWWGTAIFSVAVGCGTGSEHISERAAVETAARALMGKPAFDRSVPVRVVRSAGAYRVEFRFPVPAGRRGETYHSFALVDARSGEVLELGIEQDEAAQAEAPAPRHDWRRTPLGAEVDEVSEIQRRLAR